MMIFETKRDRNIFIIFWLVGIILIGTIGLSNHVKKKIIHKTDNIIYEETGYTITAYCPGSCCNGKWSNQSAVGTYLNYYIVNDIPICAVDPKVIPLYSVIEYNGVEYLCIDTGGAIKGKRIDILYPTHDTALQFGIKYNQSIKRSKI